MEINLVTEAFKFMILGMGIVFTFLTVMIFALKAQAALISKYFPITEKEKTNPVQTKVSASDTAKKIAAITAAIQHHKNLKG